MGKVVVSAAVENLNDIFAERKGQLPADQIRRVDVTDALIDTGATGLLMPKRMIDALGLAPLALGPNDRRAGFAPSISGGAIDHPRPRLHQRRG